MKTQKMDLSQLKSGDKVKLKLIQPPIMCEGRDRRECYYKGKVVEVDRFPGFTTLLIKFKYKGRWLLEHYQTGRNFGFVRGEISDIKIVG